MIPYKPAFAAALSSSVPAVITPLPPLPASAIEMLESAPRERALPALEVSAVAVASTSSLPARFTFCQVNRLRAEFDLTQIKAVAIALLHHVKLKYVLWYCNTRIAFGSRWVKPGGRVWNGAKACAQPDARRTEPDEHRSPPLAHDCSECPARTRCVQRQAGARRGRRQCGRMRRLPHRPRIPL